MPRTARRIDLILPPRATSEGTVKARTAIICRKVGVAGRPQLLDLFIEDLTAGPALVPEARPRAPQSSAA